MLEIVHALAHNVNKSMAEMRKLVGLAATDPP